MHKTVNQLSPAIGHICNYPSNGLMVEVRVIDAKNSYGVPRLLIEPVSGSGQTWVNVDSLRPTN